MGLWFDWTHQTDANFVFVSLNAQSGIAIIYLKHIFDFTKD